MGENGLILPIWPQIFSVVFFIMDAFTEDDKKYMRLALDLARKAGKATRPNPLVGAVIVKDGQIISTGYHKKAGTDHAEIAAIKAAGQPLSGSKMVVTLEPCTVYGRTPPCVDQLIQYGFAEVVIGSRDPNPNIHGQGIKKLRDANIQVKEGLFAQEVALQNEEFFKNMKTGLPFVISKMALSLDGKTATSCRDSKWITSPSSRKLVQKLRKDAGCLITGIGTVAADNPYLYPRQPLEDTNLKQGRLKNFYRAIFDTHLRIGLDSHIAKTLDKVETILLTASSDQNKIGTLQQRGALVEKVPCRDNRVDIKQALSVLYQKYGITAALLESGPALNTAFFKQGAIDKLIVFFGPLIIGGSGLSVFADLGVEKMSQSYLVDFADIKRIGNDLMLTAYPRKHVYRNHSANRKN